MPHRHYKDVIQWNDNDTITYQQRKRWEFIEEESPYSLDEIISNINIIALVSTPGPRTLQYHLGECLSYKLIHLSIDFN